MNKTVLKRGVLGRWFIWCDMSHWSFRRACLTPERVTAASLFSDRFLLSSTSFQYRDRASFADNILAGEILSIPPLLPVNPHRVL